MDLLSGRDGLLGSECTCVTNWNANDLVRQWWNIWSICSSMGDTIEHANQVCCVRENSWNDSECWHVLVTSFYFQQSPQRDQ